MHLCAYSTTVVVIVLCMNGMQFTGRDCMIIGFTTTCVISVLSSLSYAAESRSWSCVLDTTLCDKVCQ